MIVIQKKPHLLAGLTSLNLLNFENPQFTVFFLGCQTGNQSHWKNH